MTIRTTHAPHGGERCPSCGQAVPHRNQAHDRGTVTDLSTTLSALELPLSELWTTPPRAGA